jgi:polar amino acid transport system permease protein
MPNTVSVDAQRDLDTHAQARHRPRPGRWIAAALILLLLAMIIKGAAVNEAMHWTLVGQYLFSAPIMKGLLLTVELTAVAMVIGVALGLLLAVMRLSDNPVLRSVSYGYVWVFRGIPLLVQLLFWYFLAAVLPYVGIGVPFGPVWDDWSVNSLISKFTAAILGLALNEAAFSSEIIRGGIQSVDPGQREAADALGLTAWQRLRRIILPQAMHFIIPPLGNQLISMLKNTSLVLVIALPELLTTVSNIYAQNFLQIPLLVVACIWYLACFAVLCVAQYYLEKRFARGTASSRRAPGVTATAGPAGTGTAAAAGKELG